MYPYLWIRCKPIYCTLYGIIKNLELNCKDTTKISKNYIMDFNSIFVMDSIITETYIQSKAPISHFLEGISMYVLRYIVFSTDNEGSSHGIVHHNIHRMWSLNMRISGHNITASHSKVDTI